jgi:hypothetical protein
MRLTALLPLTLIALGASPAFATGTLDCVARDGSTEIDVHAVVPYGMGSPLLQVVATTTADLPEVAEDLRTAEFDHAVQYWLDGEEIRLLFYTERLEGPYGHVMLEIRTSRVQDDEEGTYQGTYHLEAADGTSDQPEAVYARTKGEITCSAG